MSDNEYVLILAALDAARSETFQRWRICWEVRTWPPRHPLEYAEWKLMITDIAKRLQDLNDAKLELVNYKHFIESLPA